MHLLHVSGVFSAVRFGQGSQIVVVRIGDRVRSGSWLCFGLVRISG